MAKLPGQMVRCDDNVLLSYNQRSRVSVRGVTTPRTAPCSPREMGVVNAVVAWLYARRLGIPVLPNVFTTLARNRRLFRPYLSFAYKLMPTGTLARKDTELLILRAAVNARSHYEWYQHSRIGRRVGLTSTEIERTKIGWQAAGWSSDQSTLLRAADELHSDHSLSDETWAALRTRLDVPQVMELCMLVGNYEMLAMLLNTLRVQLEDEPAA